MSMDKNTKIKIMVASTVYGFQDQLSAIVAQLNTLGYEVINSHMGTMKTNSELSNLENCLNAVDECDLFLGIIRPFYGSGNIDEKNITFEEIKRAIELKKPYWFLVHRDVVFARQLFKKMKVKNSSKKLFDVICIQPNAIFDSRSIDVYEHVTKLHNGNWVQEFYRLDEAMIYVNTQFSDKEFIMNILEQKEANNGK